MQLPPNVSPVSASFFGQVRPGIHLVLCLACSHISVHLYVIREYTCVILCFNSGFGTSGRHALSKIEGLSVRLFNVRLSERPRWELLRQLESGKQCKQQTVYRIGSSFCLDLEVDNPRIPEIIKAP